MKVYVINLERASERRRHILRELEKHGLDYELIAGVDGKSLSEDERNRVSDRAAVEARPNKLTAGAIGCALSHLEVYRKMIADNADVALVLEDDAVLFDGIGELLKLIENKIEDGEAILLHYFKVRPEKVILSSQRATPLDGNYSLLEPINYPQSGTGYVITRETALRLADAKLPIKVEADDWEDFVRNDVIESVRCVYPKPMMVAHGKSQIQPFKSYQEMTRLRQKIYRLISENQIPILYRIVGKLSEMREKYGRTIVLVNEPPVSAPERSLGASKT